MTFLQIGLSLSPELLHMLFHPGAQSDTLLQWSLPLSDTV